MGDRRQGKSWSAFMWAWQTAACGKTAYLIAGDADWRVCMVDGVIVWTPFVRIRSAA